VGHHVDVRRVGVSKLARHCGGLLYRKRLDLGQFERFKRVFFTPWFQPLVGHVSVSVLSQLLVTPDLWKSRLLVMHGQAGRHCATFEVTLSRV
jgi:hypothetical protein